MAKKIKKKPDNIFPGINPTIVNIDGGGSHYQPGADVVYFDVNGPKSAMNHELFHSYQRALGKLSVPEFYDGPLKKPSVVSTDELESRYYNRRGVDKEIMYQDFVNAVPEFSFIPPQVVMDKAIEPDMYNVPWTAEGEAEYFENTGKLPDGYRKGGLVKPPVVKTTELSPYEFAMYSTWRGMLPENLQYEGDYDLKGYWKKYRDFNSGNGGHLTDEFKLPNHETFSNESVYYNKTTHPWAGYWKGETYIPFNPKAKYTQDENSQLNSVNSNVKKSKYNSGGSADNFTPLSDAEAAYYYMNNIPLPNSKTSKKGKKNNITVTEELIPAVPSTIPVPPISFTPQQVPVPKSLKKKNISFEEQRDAKGNLIAYSPVFNNYTQSETRKAGKSLPDNINGVPVQFSPFTYGELWSGYLPGTQSDQWKYRKGGKVKDPIYTSDPTDKRPQMYRDSLTLYNVTKGMIKDFDNEFSGADSRGIGWFDYMENWNEKNGKKTNAALNRLKSNNGEFPKPIKYRSNGFDPSFKAEAMEYARPIQPVIYNPNMEMDRLQPVNGQMSINISESTPQETHGSYMVPYSFGEPKYPGGYRESGFKKMYYASGGQPMNSNQIPYLNWNTMDQWQMPENSQQPSPQDPRIRENMMRRKVAGTLGAIGNGIQNTVDAFDTVTQFATGIQNRKNQDKALELQGLSDNQFYTGQGSDRGDYFNGMYKPNQMGNYSYAGMYNGVYYPTAALGIEVPVLPNTDGIVNTPTVPMMVPEKSIGNIGNIKEFIKQRESSGNYGALPRKKDGKLASSAVGAYQFLWNQHKDWITRVTGVGSKEQFRTNPQAQDAAFDYWDKTVLTPAAKKIKSMFPNVSTNDAKAKIHFAGVQGAMDYYTRGIETTDAFGTKTSTYEVGGEYTLSEKEIENILRNGGEVEYL